MKIRPDDWPLLGALLFLGTGAWLLWASLECPPLNPAHEGIANQGSSADGESNVGTPLMLVLTAVLAVAALWQVRISRKTAVSQLRAYVLLAETTPPQNNHYFVAWRLVFKNYGQTPAAKVAIWVNSEIVLERQRVELTAWVNKPNLGVDHTFEVTVEHHLGNGQLKAIVAGEKFITVCGEVRYEDVFGKPRRTPFRLQCTGTRDHWDLQVAVDGNDWT